MTGIGLTCVQGIIVFYIRGNTSMDNLDNMDNKFFVVGKCKEVAIKTPSFLTTVVHMRIEDQVLLLGY